MNISLHPSLARFVEDQVRNGRFRTADDVVNGALARLQAEEELSAADVESLRAQVAVGVEQADRGDFEPWDASEIEAEVERRFDEEQKPGSQRPR